MNKEPSFVELYRFASPTDKALAVVGFTISIINGASIPLLALLTGSSVNALGEASALQAILPVFYFYIGVGLVTFVLTFAQNSCFSVASQHIGHEVRCRYVQAMLDQELGWFECQKSAELANRLTVQVNALQKSTSEQTTNLVTMACSVVVCLIVALTKGWELTLLACISLPIITAAGYYFMKLINTNASLTKEMYAEAGGKAEQVLTSIATVKCLNGEGYEYDNYLAKARQAQTRSVRNGWQAAVTIGLFIATIPLFSALVFYIGSSYIAQQKFNSATGKVYQAGDIITVYFSVLLSGLNLGQVFPTLKGLQEGPAAAAAIYEIIDRKPLITDGPVSTPPCFEQGTIEMREVCFNYPARKAPVLQGLNLSILVGKRNALVGQSGCGKSTVTQLLMRMYDPQHGEIIIEGKNIKEFSRQALLSTVGYVGQEPALFATSLRENISFGSNADDDQIWQALKQAEAFDFVSALPEKLDTFVGPGGSKLSGGQKQRIAIARAIVRKPKLLILDEATSALDRMNERLIQQTLDRLSERLTTVVIAHKLQTIMKADRINVIENGRVAAFGKFGELAQNNEWFQECLQRELVRKQQESQDKKSSLLQATTQQSSAISRIVPAQDQQNQQLLISSEDQLASPEPQFNYMWRLASYSREDWPVIVLSFLSALANGTLLPIFAFLLARMISVLVLMQQMTDTATLALDFFLIGLAIFLLNFLQYGLFNTLSENVTLKLRSDVFKKLLEMPMRFFGKKGNSVGALSQYLFADMNNCSRLTSSFIGLNLQNVSSLVSGLVIALVYYWLLCLISLLTLPLLILAALVQLKISAHLGGLIDVYYRDSAGLLSEFILSIKTIKAFGCEQHVFKLYQSILQNAKPLTQRKVVYGALFFGLSQFVFFLVFGIIFLSGAAFVDIKVLNQESTRLQIINKVLTCVLATLFCSTPIGYYAQFMPDIAAGRESALRIFALLDTPLENKALQTLEFPAQFKELQFKQLSFTHEGKQKPAVQNLSFKLRKGQKMALTGPSGSGKSTVVQLLLKLQRADNLKGQIFVNGLYLNSITQKSLRSKVSIVQQQPVLFNCTLRQNICYNLALPEEDYQAVKRLARIDFMQDDELVGIKGGLLSGGQKQRIAIARAIVRKPELLILDEATSALDNQCEREVLQALAALGADLTTIAVAHRLSTIRHSNQILVLHEGRLVQEGDYQQLQAKKGFFYRLESGLKFQG